MAVDVSMWSSEAWSSAADLYLLSLAREGSDEAFAELWRRNLPAAYAMADRYKGRAHAEDIVAEAATRVLSLIKEGRGPEENFRAYFLSAVRSVAVDSGRRTLQLVPTAADDLDSLLDPVLDAPDGDEFDPTLVRAAFAALPERDQRILWHTTVEGEAPRNIAPQLGMSPNGVSVRAMRAREALRVNYLEAYAAQRRHGARTAECQWAIGVLGTEVRGRLPKRASDRLHEHLQGCAHESAVLVELKAIQERFPAVIVPLLFLAGASTSGFLGAAALAGGGAAATVGAAATAGGSTATAGGSTAGGSAAGPAAGGWGATAGAGVGGTAPSQGARAADLASNLAGRATVLAAALLVGIGIVAGRPSPLGPVSAAAVSPTATVSTPAPPSAPTTPDVVVSASATPPATRSSAAPVAPSPVAVPPVTSVLQLPTPSALTSPPRLPTRLAGPDIQLRTLQSGPSTRFSIRFTTATTGALRIGVATLTGTGQLSVDNGPFTCTSPSASSITCTGRDGHLLVTLSPTGSTQSVVVTATDSLGGTTTHTFTVG